MSNVSAIFEYPNCVVSYFPEYNSVLGIFAAETVQAKVCFENEGNMSFWAFHIGIPLTLRALPLSTADFSVSQVVSSRAWAESENLY